MRRLVRAAHSIRSAVIARARVAERSARARAHEMEAAFKKRVGRPVRPLAGELIAGGSRAGIEVCTTRCSTGRRLVQQRMRLIQPAAAQRLYRSNLGVAGGLQLVAVQSGAGLSLVSAAAKPQPGRVRSSALA